MVIDGGYMVMTIVTALGIIGLGTVIGTSAFLFKRRPRENNRFEDDKKEVLTLTLRGLQDVDMICDTVAEGNVVILGVRDLAKLDMIRLKRSIQQLKSFTMTNGGDILALGKDFVVIVPPTMKLSLLKRILNESNDYATDSEDMNPPEPPTEVGML
jgi:SepF-like predicted cell division protein (DUF552 family)